MSVLARRHGTGDELGKILTERCLSGLGEILGGRHAIDVRGLGHGNLIFTAVDLHAEEI